MRYMLTDEHWASLEALVLASNRHTGGQPPRLPEWMFLEALLYWARTGIPWRDLPTEFGAWDALYKRFRRWVASGGLRRLFESLTADPRFGEVPRVLLDSSIIRAHVHAAGAARKKSGWGRPGRRPGRGWAVRGAATPARSS
jgi:putative transposase